MHRDSNEVIRSQASVRLQGVRQARHRRAAGFSLEGKAGRWDGLSLVSNWRFKMTCQDSSQITSKKYRAIPLIYGVQFSLFGCSRMDRSLRRLSTKNRRAPALSYFLQIASPK